MIYILIYLHDRYNTVHDHNIMYTINTSLLVFIFVNNLKVVRYNKYQFTGIYLCEQPKGCSLQ